MIKLVTYKQFEESKGIKYLLHKKLATSDVPRSIDILHASELTSVEKKFCPRERAFLLRDGDNRKDNFLGTALNITFFVGRWYEHHIRNTWLREYSIGNWECTSCGYVLEYQTAPSHEDACAGCGASGSRYEYIEPRAYSKKYEVSCGIDQMVWRNERISIVEIKTIDKIQFKDLKAPLHEHYKRTQFYLDLLEESDWMDLDADFNLDTATILYVCKGFGFKDKYKDREAIPDTRCSPFKEYTVKRGKHKDMLSIYKMALQVKKFRADGVLPKRDVCPTPTCTRAGLCTYVKECFAEK